MMAASSRLPPAPIGGDYLDDDGISPEPVRIAVSIHVAKSWGKRKQREAGVTIDFTGSSPQVQVLSMRWSHHLFSLLLCVPLPAARGRTSHGRTDGPIKVIAPAGTVVNARPPAAVAGATSETRSGS